MSFFIYYCLVVIIFIFVILFCFISVLFFVGPKAHLINILGLLGFFFLFFWPTTAAFNKPSNAGPCLPSSLLATKPNGHTRPHAPGNPHAPKPMAFLSHAASMPLPVLSHANQLLVTPHLLARRMIPRRAHALAGFLSCPKFTCTHLLPSQQHTTAQVH